MDLPAYDSRVLLALPPGGIVDKTLSCFCSKPDCIMQNNCLTKAQQVILTEIVFRKVCNHGDKLYVSYDIAFLRINPIQTCRIG